MTPADAVALFLLFNGHNLDGWKTLSGDWAAEDGAIVCKAPGMIRCSFESDAYALTFEYRKPDRQVSADGFEPILGQVTPNARLDGKGTTLNLIPLGVDHARSIFIGPSLRRRVPPEEWIRGEIRVKPGGIEAHKFGANGVHIVGPHNVPNGERGFIVFSASEPGLQIRSIKVTEPGFTPLFDGKTTKGWEPVGDDDPEHPNWTVQDGALVCGHKGGIWLRTKESYDNFVIRLEYWLPKGGNSGVYLHAPLEGRVSQIGQEIQLIDDAGWGGKLKPQQYTGSVYAGIAPEVHVPALAKEWNAIEIFTQGKHVRTTLNGVQLYDARLDDASKDAKLLGNPLATRRLTGFIGLQDHTGSPRFRNIRIRTLPPDSQPDAG